MYMFLLVLFSSFISSTSDAACNCGSTDINNPCMGQDITITVTAGTPNGGEAHNGIYQWFFNSGGNDASCGQFANGDYWISPAPNQTSVTVTAITTRSVGKIAAEKDPVPEATSLIGGLKQYGNFDESKNIIPKLPQTYSQITSLVAAIERNEAIEGNCGTTSILGGCADSYNVITILPTVPENCGSTVIRPNITGEHKDLLTFSNISLKKLPQINFLTGTDSVGLEAIRERWSHSTEIFGLGIATCKGGYCSEGGRAFRSHTLIDDYGGGTAVSIYSDILTILSSHNSIEEKVPAIAAILSYGSDLYHAIYDPPQGIVRWWGAGATQHPGKFVAPIFLAALSTQSSYREHLQEASKYVHDDPNNGPHELAQVQNLRGSNYLWGDEVFGASEEGAYWDSLWKSQCYDGAKGTCVTNIGKKTGRDPYGYIDGPPNKPGTEYFVTSLGIQRSLVALMSLWPAIEEIVNYPPLISYVDRVNNLGVSTADDLCATPDNREEIGGGCSPYTGSGCKYYKITWGPDPNNPGDCIKVATPPYTKIGRFYNINGKLITSLYSSPQVEINWQVIREFEKSAEFIPVPSSFSLLNTSK